jgi:hypothetical protein
VGLQAHDLVTYLSFCRIGLLSTYIFVVVAGQTINIGTHKMQFTSRRKSDNVLNVAMSSSSARKIVNKNVSSTALSLAERKEILQLIVVQDKKSGHGNTGAAV